jgi:orotidine-5'-phosphate decarboxylase
VAFSIGNRLIAALDVPTRTDADALLARLDRVPRWVKIGLELFCSAGPTIVTDYVKRGYAVMLDLKLHDIPETVGRATRQVVALGPSLITIHTDGGRAMMMAALEAAGGSETKVLGVTVLTSLDDGDLEEIGARGPVASLVHTRAQLAIEAGCHGVVASPQEAAAIRRFAPNDFLIVTPGVRPAGAATGDQKRVMTPRDARAAGADLVVVGRPLRDAKDPAATAREIVADLQ